MATSMVVSAAGAVLLADFLSGAVHWAEDAYARKDTPIIGKWIGQANIEHHVKPRAFVVRGWWASSWDLALASTAVVIGAWWLNMLTWQVWLFAIVAANANQIHKWAHRAPHENGAFVTWLQRMKLIQTQRHHAKHHSGKKDSHYCSITNFLNPILEELEFWQKLERFNARVFGLKRKPDPTVHA
ncbi:MAG: fatty acid desaturase CarF family protein [Burkholderiaceae bacterium]